MMLWLWMLAGIILVGLAVKTVFDMTEPDEEWDDILEVLRRIT